MDNNSAQHKAIQALQVYLVNALFSEPEIDTLIHRAWSKNLVEQQQFDISSSSADQKATSFVAEIASKASLDHTIFDQFVSLLREFQSLEYLAKRLQDELILILEQGWDDTSLSVSESVEVPFTSQLSQRPLSEQPKLDLAEDSRTQTVESEYLEHDRDFGLPVGEQQVWGVSGSSDVHIPQLDSQAYFQSFRKVGGDDGFASHSGGLVSTQGEEDIKDQGLNMSTQKAFVVHYAELVLETCDNIKTIADECRGASLIGKDVHEKITQLDGTGTDKARMLLSAVESRIISQAAVAFLDPEKCVFTRFVAILKKDPSTESTAEKLATTRIDFENRAQTRPCTEEPHSTFISTPSTIGEGNSFEASVKTVVPESATSKGAEQQVLGTLARIGTTNITKSSLSQNKDECKHLKEQLLWKQKEISNLRHQKRMTESQLETEIDLKKELDTAIAEKEALAKKCETIETEVIPDLERTIQELKEKVTVCKSENDRLRVVLVSSQSKEQCILQEMKQLTKQISDLEALVDENDAKTQLLEGWLNQVIQERESLVDDRLSAVLVSSQSKEQLAEQLASKDQRISDLEALVDEKDAKTQLLERWLNQVIQEKETAENKLKEDALIHNAGIKTLTEELASTKTELEQNVELIRLLI